MPATESPWRWRAIRLPKHGYPEEECEDAWAADPAAGRFAVADGASECAFAALWARLLADTLVAAPWPGAVAAWLDAPRRLWLKEVMGLELPWYAEMKRDEGAFATLLGLDLRAPVGNRPGGWRAVAIGDTCLVRVRRRHQVQAFPLSRAADFDNQPSLVGSHDVPPPEPLRCAGSFRRGDRLLLMTDALAQWFLGDWERGGRPWDAIARLLSTARPEEAFAAWIEDLRAAAELRDDDVTLLSIDSSCVPTE
ncbi:MAG TPA: protein phosphatase 2C domain-containing protein [Gemmataceae bacterium]|nr:protein phosphatase 2C domain-containing protein [Gemmataceae bacterium]